MSETTAPDRLFRLGCAVWACKDWIGDFFPAGSHSPDFLRLYGQRLTTVEGNTTFYSIPSSETVQRWACETPAYFRFCPKMPRAVSHAGALLPHVTEALNFGALMQGLGTRLGPLLLQLPPRYSPAAYADLVAFLEAWPHSDIPLALEVRHLDWFKPAVAERLNARLMDLGVGRILLDTRPIYDLAEMDHDPQLQSERRKPRVPLQAIVTAPFAIVRYISHPDLTQNERFLAEWVRSLDQWLKQGTEIYVFIHCPIEARSVGIARHFQRLLEQSAVPVPELPWNLLENSPEQLALF